MKKQKRTIRELFVLAKGKPAKCCQADPSSKEEVSEKSSEKCCAAKNENSCC